MSAIEKLAGAPGTGLKNTSPSIIELAGTARMHSLPFIGGEFVDSRGGKIVKNYTPINHAVLNEVQFGSEADVDRAVEAGRSAFDDGSWSQLAPRERKLLMRKFYEALLQSADELAILDSLDVGKPFEAAREVDIDEVLASVSWYGEAIDKVYGQVAPTPNVDFIVREPMGVVGAIVPWNYPLMIAAWKFAPILAAGNSLILKPAEQSPLSALRTAEIATEAGIPPGVFNVVPGEGEVVGRALARHHGVDGIAFTGSTRVGRSLLTYAGESTIKSISLECGGKSAAIVCEDANVAEAAAAIAGGLFYNAGQTCNAPTRALVHAAVVGDFVEALRAEAVQYMPDNPLAAGVNVGCIVSQGQLQRVTDYIQIGQEEGARVAFGGKAMHKASGGFYFEPTALVGANREMRISKEEIFGPVLPVESFENLEDAVVSANSTEYGLWGSIWTNNLEASIYAARHMRSGTVAVNDAFGGDITTPLGGMKQSGTGRDRSFEAFYKYCQVKHVHFNL